MSPGLRACLLGVLALVATAPWGFAAAVPSGSEAQMFQFDIPSQPLDDALNRYASLTERAMLFRSDVVAGRTSSAVRGRYTPEQALSLLLEGTGLAAERTRTGPVEAFALRILGPPAPSMEDALAAAGDYPGGVQAGLWDALCSDPRTVPGRYRAVVRFRVDRGGRPGPVELMATTGDARRDAAIVEVLGRLRMPPPPPGMPQPMTLLILPQSGGDAAACVDDDDGSGRTGMH